MTPEIIVQTPTPQAPSTSTAAGTPKLVETPVQTPAPEPAAIKASDIIKKVSTEKPTTPVDSEPFYNSSDIDKLVKDPVQNKILKDVYKSMSDGLNKKFMQLADKQRQLDSANGGNSWTPDRVLSVANDPGFIRASQELMRQSQTAPPAWSGSSEEWSALTPQEKQEVTNLKTQVNNLLSRQDQLLVQQADSTIKTRFPDYDPSKVDRFQDEIAGNRIPVSDIRELIWKAMNFDRYVESTYRQALEDKQAVITDKVNGSTFSPGSTSQVTEGAPTRAENETSQAWFSRLGRWRLDQAKQKQGLVR